MKFKNHNTVLFSLWCLLFISPIFANVNYVDFRQDFVNSNYAQNYYITFTLTNDLGTDQYVKLEFPIPLDATTGMAAAWTQDVLSATKLLPTYFPATITASTIPGDSSFNRYFVKFLDSSNNAVKLTANAAYMLRVTSSQPYVASSDGYIDIVRVYTTSSNQENHIILDSNPTFSPLYFLTATPATVAITVGSGTIQAGSTQTVTVSYTPTVTLTPYAKVIINLGSAQFNIQGSTCSGTLPSPFNDCSLPTGQQVIFTANSAVSSGSSITFSLDILAPNQGSQTSSMTLLSVQDYYSDIKETGTQASALSSTAITWAASAYSATFAWGFSTVLDSSIPTAIQLYTNGPTQTVYNTIKFSFTVGSTLPVSVYKVSVDLTGAASILVNSVLQNLPVASGSSKVICRAGTATIECSNVDTLTSGSTYYIAVKVSLTNTASGLNANFGNIGLYATDSITGTYSTGSIITPQRATFTVGAVANLDKQVTGTVPVTSWPPSVTADSTKPGLKTGSVNYYDFRLNTARTDFDASATFSSANGGLEIFTNGYMITQGAGTALCSSSGASVGSGSQLYCSTTTLSAAFQSRSTLRFRVGWNVAGNNAVFNGANGFQVTYSSGNEPTVSQGTYVADDTVTDFFFSACGSGLNSGTNFVSGCLSSYMMNAYTISSPGSGGFLYAGNFNVYLSNFWTSASTDYLTGNEFPAVVQIKGTFASGDYSANTDRLSLFFTYLTPFVDADYSTTNKVACSANVDVTCYYYPGVDTINNYMYYSRVDIFPTAGFNTNLLSIVVPMATRANQLSISTVLGTGQTYSTLTTTTSLGSLQNAKLFTFSFSAFASNQLYSVDSSDLNNVNYTLDTTSMRAGEVTTGVIAANHDDATGVAFSPNTATYKSALFTWTTKYNFFPSRTTANQATADFTGSEVCVFFSYYYAADTTYPYRYGVTCPVNANLAMPTTPEPLIYIPDFVYPIVEGVNIPESFGSLSSNQGVLLEFQRDVRTNATSPNYIVGATFDPVLQQGEKGSIATLSFNTTNILPQNSVIKISTTSVPLQFSVKEGVYCALYQDTVPDLETTTLPGNCYQSSAEYELTFVITNSAAWTSNVYFLKLYEINITSYIQVSSQVYDVSTYTSQYFMIDTTVTGVSTVVPVYFLTQVRSSDISIGDATFLSNAQNTRSQVLVTVTTSTIKPLTRFDELRIKFWTVSDALDENFYCDVVDDGLASTFTFQYCKIDPPFVALRPYYDLLTPKTFTIRLASVKNPLTANTLSFYQWDLEGNYMLNSTNSFTYPTTFTNPPIFNTFIMEKRYNYITMFPEFIFTLNLKIALTKDNALIFRFPSGYSAADITEPLLCIIDNLESHCYLSNFQEITITDLPLPQAANQVFRVFILGLRQPYLTKAFNISLQVSTKDDLYTPLAYQELADTIPDTSSSLDPIHVPRVTLGTAFSIDDPDITIQFNIDSTGAGSLTSRSLILDFPNLYGLVYHNVTLDYTLSQGGTTLMDDSVKFKLFRIEIPLTVSISEATTYTLVLKKIPNPFLEIYSQPLVVLSITGSNTFVLGYQGIRPIINIPGPTGYYYDPAKNNLKFSQINSDGTKTAMSYNAPFQVYSGLPTLQFEMSIAENVRFDRSVSYTSSSFNEISFTSTPTSLNATCGLYGYQFSLTLPTSAAPGYYALKFDKTEIDPATLLATDYYSQIPPLLIQIIATRNTIKLPTFTDNTLSLAENGYSFPITFDLSEFKPPTSLTIVAYIPPTSDMEIQFEAYTEITLTSDEPSGSFTLVHMGGGTPDVSTTTISFYLDGPDKDLYAIDSTPITVALVELPTTLPSLTVNFDTTSLTETGFQVTASCDQITQMYYEIVGNYGYPTNYWQTSSNVDDTDDLAYVKEMVRVGTLYENDEFQRRDIFFGVWLYETTGVTETFTITGLRSNVAYTLKVWAVNLEGTSSEQYEYQFTTSVNSGSRAAISVTFDQVLENRQINEIACFIMVRHRLPYQNVKDFLGYSCNDDRTMNPTDEDNVMSSQNRIYQLRGASSYTYNFYVYPMAFLNYDDTTLNVVNSVVNSTFENDLITLMSTWNFAIPNLVGSPTSALLTSTDVEFWDASSATVEKFTVTSTNSTITLKDVRLNQAGFVWVYALRKATHFSSFADLFVPNKGDFKFYLNRRLDDQNYVAMRYYDGTNPLQIQFDGLKVNDDYILHWFGQNDDPGAQNRTTYTYTTFVSTKGAERITSWFAVVIALIVLIIV